MLTLASPLFLAPIAKNTSVSALDSALSLFWETNPLRISTYVKTIGGCWCIMPGACPARSLPLADGALTATNSEVIAKYAG